MNIQQQVALSQEQVKVLQMTVQGGQNLFFTGSAGTGKSLLLRNLIQILKIVHEKEGAVAVTATTGIAAFNIGFVYLCNSRLSSLALVLF